MNTLIPTRLEETKTFLRDYRKSLYCNSTCDFCNSTCEVQCATNQIKVLMKDARRHINQTTRANLIEVVKDLVNRLGGLGKYCSRFYKYSYPLTLI